MMMAGGLHGLDRAAMEVERLARVRGRSGEKREREEEEVVVGKVGIVRQRVLDFPIGAVRMTATRGVKAEDVRALTIEDILQKDDGLEVAVVGAYVIMEDWFMSKVDKQRTRVVFVNLKGGGGDGEYVRPPDGNGVRIHHSKLMLLFHATYLRVVVSSANLCDYDYGETGIMENVLFLQDFPPGDASGDDGKNAFHADLVRYVTYCRYPADIISRLHAFDYSLALSKLVYTLGGTQTAKEGETLGLGALSRAVTSPSVDITFISSSIGFLKAAFIQAILDACKAQRLTIHFPSHETVRASRGGESCGGTICMSQRAWNAADFPRHLFRDAVHCVPGVLQHHKIIASDSFVYVGSANCSESAWGAKTKKGITFRNYEMGVVVDPSIVSMPSAKGVIVDSILDLPKCQSLSQTHKPWMLAGF